MSNGTREIEIPLPRLLRARLIAAAKAEKRSVSALIVDAVKADLRSIRPKPSPKKSRLHP